MSYDYSEKLIQDSAVKLLKNELGWEIDEAYDKEVIGIKSTYGRGSYKEVILEKELRKALKKLNPWLVEQQFTEIKQKLEETLSTSSLIQINEEKYRLIRDGIPVTVKNTNGETSQRTAVLIDFRKPERNRFLALTELNVNGSLHRRRADIVGFVNGLPLLFVELKRSDVELENAYTDNYSDYLDTIPQLFYYNAFVMFSNGLEAKVGTIGSKYRFFHEWKRLVESDPGDVAFETMLRGICNKENFLDLIENFILFDHSRGNTVKILARNHQFLGVNEAVKSYEARKLNNGKLGVFWHTQGSGKSFSMIFLAQKIRRKFKGSPTIVVLTDREELNKQISETFSSCGLLGDVKASRFIATDGKDLIDKLKSNPSFIFTLIHKFNQPVKEPIVPDHDIIIMSDEAHRTQYGKFADNMMRLLPTASRIGFTGTPLMSDDNITARTFGDYISIYDFQRAVQDGATVPLYYEPRGDKIANLNNPEITDRILDAIERADLDVDQRDRIEAEISKEIHILTAEPRLRSVAKDFARHYSDLWTSGKAMFICLNKVTCVRMFNYVQEYWKDEIKNLEAQIKKAGQQETLELENKLRWMRETEMAVVVSQEQNELKDFDKWGLDIKYHRAKMEKRELDKEFKDPENPLRVVFVCAMWLTGFDVKCLSCMYLDKPLKAHTLMQAIARANRVDEGKENGLIVDYVGIVKALKRALADYTKNASTPGVDPTVDKEKLLLRISETIEKAKDFLHQRGFTLQDMIDAEYFKKIALVRGAANAVSGTLEDKRTYSTYVSELKRMMKFADRDDVTGDTRKEYNSLNAVFDHLHKKRKHADTTNLMVEINSIVGDYIKIEQPDQDKTVNSRRFDISEIDFDLLKREFKRAKHKNLAIRDLEYLLKHRLDMLLKTNPQRINYYERYETIIDEYNQEQDRATIEKTFMELMNLAKSMGQEEQRYIREDFTSDEELTIYDMLFREDLSPKDIKKIKKVASELLNRIKAKIAKMDHWTDKQETRAEVEILIRDTLYVDLPESYEEKSIDVYKQKIYEYVFMHYRETASAV